MVPKAPRMTYMPTTGAMSKAMGIDSKKLLRSPVRYGVYLALVAVGSGVMAILTWTVVV